MARYPSADAEAIQLSSLARQYVKVEKETQKLAEELQNSRRKRSQLEAEVRFLQQKLRFFKSNPDHDTHPEILGLNRELLSPPADHQRQASKMVDAPQFFEVEVKFADLSSLENGLINSSVLDYSPSPSKFRRDFDPHMYSRQRKVFWQDKDPIMA